MTQHYVGTKIIEAWEQPKAGTGEPGYAVKYPDGYISWSPEKAFIEAYLPLGHIGHLPPHVQRVVAERAQLDDKLEKLLAFLDSPRSAQLEAIDQELLARQANLMQAYSNVLAHRLERMQ